MNILIIEDERLIQEGYRRMLTGMFDDPPTVRITDNADVAIGELTLLDYDLIISDYDLVGSTGGDVLDWIKVNAPHLVERFIFITGNSTAEQLHHRVLRKPAERSEIREAIGSILG